MKEDGEGGNADLEVAARDSIIEDISATQNRVEYVNTSRRRRDHGSLYTGSAMNTAGGGAGGVSSSNYQVREGQNNIISGSRLTNNDDISDESRMTQINLLANVSGGQGE